MAALALCIVDFEKQHHPHWSDEAFLQKASFLARLGSGSAARSIAGPVMVWGESTAFLGSSDQYAIVPQREWHPIFQNFQEALVNNEQVFNDGNLKQEYLSSSHYSPKLVIIDDMSLGDLVKQPGMDVIIESNYVDIIDFKLKHRDRYIYYYILKKK